MGRMLVRALLAVFLIVPFFSPKILAEDKYGADGFLLRTDTEIFSLYSTAVLNGVHSAWFLTSFADSGDARRRLAGFGGAPILIGGLAGVAYADWHGMHYGVPTAISSMYSTGFLTGLLFGMTKSTINDKGQRWKFFVKSTFPFSVAESVSAGFISHYAELYPGQWMFISTTSNWSAGLGLGAATSFVHDEDRYKLTKGVALSGLIPHLAALGASSFAVSQGYSPSVRRMQFINLAGLGGGLLGATMMLFVPDRNTRKWSAALSGGSFLGLCTGLIVSSGIPDDHRPLHKESLSFDVQPQIAGARLNFRWVF